MADNGQVRRIIGEGVIMNTEASDKSKPPAVYKYSINSTAFKKINFKFDFSGSRNFEVVSDFSSPENPMVVELHIDPFKVSGIVICRQVDIYQSGSLSMSMSWSYSEPDPEICVAYVEDFYTSISPLIHQGLLNFSADKARSLSRVEIERKCRELGTHFVDAAFPPSFKALFDIDRSFLDEKDYSEAIEEGKKKAIVWRRPIEFAKIGETYELFSQVIEPNDIKQGALGDCWLMCALSSIAEFPELVKALFPDEFQIASDYGVYRVRLCKNGVWITVTLDDYFPCIPEGGPVYSHANGPELWVLLLEKAFAKVHGSYAQIRSGWAFEAFVDLTGAPYRDLRFSDSAVAEQIKDGSLWRYIVQCDTDKYIMSCSTSGVDTLTESGEKRKSGGKNAPSTGLVPGHAYTILSAVTLSQGGHQLLKIRNPWGTGEWTGDWSDASSLWTPESKEEAGFINADDGTFFMCFDDFINFFVGLNVCMVRHPQLNTTPWYEVRKPIEYLFGKDGEGCLSVQLFLMNVLEDDAELHVSVHQKDKRIIGSPEYIDIGVTVFRLVSESEIEFVKASGKSAERQNQLDIYNLASGSYIVVPTSSGCKIELLKERREAEGRALADDEYKRSAVVAIHSSKTISLEEMEFDSMLLEDAMEAPALFHGVKTDLFGDESVLLYYLRSGYAGVTYVAKNNIPDEPVCLSLDFHGSENVVSSSGKLVAEKIIPQGEAKVMHHLFPSDDHKPWSLGWSCTARSLSDAEMEALRLEMLEKGEHVHLTGEY